MATTNKVRLAHDAVWDLLERSFPGATRQRNTGGKDQPAPRGQDGMAQYVALEDDSDPEVLATLCGPIYDLRIEPVVTLAFSGKVKDERSAAAWEAVETLKSAILADFTLGGAVSYAEIVAPRPVEASDTSWLAGGLDVGIEILLTAPTRGG